MAYFTQDTTIADKATKTRDKDLNAIRETTKDGSGQKPMYLKLYGRHVGHTYMAKDYLDSQDLRDKVDLFSEALDDNRYMVKKIFNVDAEPSLLIGVSLNHCTKTDIDWYHKIVNIIHDAHDLSEAKLRSYKDINDMLGIPQPREVTVMEYVRDTYAKNQKRQAFIDAIGEIFPGIKHKELLHLIAANQ